MNYSDFPDIQQDEWSLTRPTFPTPKGGDLTVVGWSGRVGRIGAHKAYIVECSECKKDPCLHGGGVFKISKQGLSKGGIPCGCARRVYWTPEQYKVLIERILNGSELKFLGFVDNNVENGNKTKVRVFCQKHGECNKTSIRQALRSGISCPSCTADRLVKIINLKKSSRPRRIAKDILEASPKSYTLRTSDKKSGGKDMVQIECSICAKDMYAEAGLCDGVFYTLPRHLLREPPQLPCRCSRRPSYTKEQLDYRAKKVCEGLGYEFVEWVKEIRTSGKIRYRCKIHGIHSIRMKNMVNGTGCPECAGKNQKQCYINTVYDNRTAVAIKFGITKDSDKRVKHQNYRNLFQMEQSAVYEFKTVKACKDAEKACKGELKCGVLSKRELKDGHSETVSLLGLEKVIAIYERFGGVRVLTPAKE